MDIRKRLLLLSGKKAAAATYLLRDEFTTDEAAPMVTPRTCEPGPGTVTVTELPVISGGAIALVGESALNRVRSSVATTKAAGRACFAKWVSGEDYGFFGYATDTFSAYKGAMSKNLYSTIGPWVGSNAAANSAMFTIWREGGGIIAVRNNRIMWVDNTPNVNTFYPAIFTSGNQSVSFSRFGEVDLGAPWNADATIYTAISAAPEAGGGITAESNALIEATWQAITGEVFELSIRVTNADNRWIVRCNQADGTVKLIQREAGSETERGTAAQTWTNGTSYRIAAVTDGTSIIVWVRTMLLINYTSAAFNQSATGVTVSHACTNLMAWPRYLTGDLLARLALVDPTVNP